MNANEKEIVELYDWELYSYEKDSKMNYYLAGIVKYHPELGKNTRISRSTYIISYKYESDVMICETKNTIYNCQLKYASTNPYAYVPLNIKKEDLKLSDDKNPILAEMVVAFAAISLGKGKKNKMAMHIVELSRIGDKELKEEVAADNQRRFNLIKDMGNCIYIEVSKVCEGDKLAYHIKGRYGVLEPSVHSGMFQDSILYTKIEDGLKLDFRYFPKGIEDVIDPYVWSEDIDRVIIKNDTEYDIYFEKKIISPGDTSVFERVDNIKM